MNSKVKDKAFTFAVRILSLHKYLCENGCNRSLANQVLRSGTSIGANVEEALCGQSNNDFIAKLSIALKECRETMYWLRLLNAGGFIQDIHFNSIYADANEISKILSSIIISCKRKRSTNS